MLNQVSKQNASGVGAAVTTQIGCDSNMVNWSIKINKRRRNSGTIALTAKSPDATTAEVVAKLWRSCCFNAATSTAATYYAYGKPIDALILTPTALDGTLKKFVLAMVIYDLRRWSSCSTARNCCIENFLLTEFCRRF